MEKHTSEKWPQGKAGLLISAHIGNFEMAGHMLERLECPGTT